MITKDTRLTEFLEKNENVEKLFERYGMYCIGCPGIVQGTVEEAANAHDVNLDELLDEINKII